MKLDLEKEENIRNEMLTSNIIRTLQSIKQSTGLVETEWAITSSDLLQ